jgi:hypothetical protein
MLRSLFGPSKDEIWAQLSREIGAEQREGGFFKNGSVRLRHREWEITLDDYVVHAGNATMVFTRIRAPYVNRDGFRFRIYRKGVFTWLGKVLGVEDLEIGDRFFDDKFVIQGEPASMVTRLFMNPQIKEYIARQPDINLQVKDDEGWFGQRFPEGVDELYFLASGVIRDKDRLRELFELFALILDELCQMGSAYETDLGRIGINDRR